MLQKWFVRTSLIMILGLTELSFAAGSGHLLVENQLTSYKGPIFDFLKDLAEKIQNGSLPVYIELQKLNSNLEELNQQASEYMPQVLELLKISTALIHGDISTLNSNLEELNGHASEYMPKVLTLMESSTELIHNDITALNKNLEEMNQHAEEYMPKVEQVIEGLNGLNNTLAHMDELVKVASGQLYYSAYVLGGAFVLGVFIAAIMAPVVKKILKDWGKNKTAIEGNIYEPVAVHEVSNESGSEGFSENYSGTF